MTLISKEELQADLHFLYDDHGNAVNDLAKRVIKTVEKADKAYDFDGVVEELIESVEQNQLNNYLYMSHDELMHEDGFTQGLIFAIEAVRSGRLDE